MEDLIFCQRDIPKDQWRYGFRTSAATGCGWIATYNALKLMGEKADPEMLIRFYERQLPLINGNCGTQFWGPYVYFKSRGFDTKLVLNPDKYVEYAGDVNILFYHWRSGIKLGAHFVCIQRTEDGFVSYNTYKNSFGPNKIGGSIQKFATNSGRFWTALITVK